MLLEPVATSTLAVLIAEDPPNNDRPRFFRKASGCLSSGLLNIHSCGMRHKDIKPQNILIH